MPQTAFRHHPENLATGPGPSFSASNHLPRLPEFITHDKHAELLKFLDALRMMSEACVAITYPHT
jgi:hypothetical protein